MASMLALTFFPAALAHCCLDFPDIKHLVKFAAVAIVTGIEGFAFSSPPPLCWLATRKRAVWRHSKCTTSLLVIIFGTD
jgi:hypothetical protein